MCGIFGYIGKKDATQVVFSGLKRLDYRGYDSWGIGIISKGRIKYDKRAGKISQVKPNLPESNIAIGHTRWATHGAVNNTNAHPHLSSDNFFALAHNGIAENYQELKKKLTKKGYKFASETDTEVIVRLIEEKAKQSKNLTTAVRQVFKEIEGRNTIVILTQKNEIIAARNGSPLVVGVNKDKTETYLSSDTLSFAPFVEKVLVLDNGQMIVCQNKTIKLYDTKSGKKLTCRFEKNQIKDSKVNKEGYDHYMIKEINEAPFVINQVVRQEKDKYLEFADAIRKAKNLYIIGSGTAGAAAAQVAYYLKRFAKIPALGLIGAESREYYELFSRGDLIIAPSQSGETADVLEVLEAAKQKGVKIASYVNMPGSMMTRMSDYKFMADAGPEICVMSTKIFVSQMAWGYLIAKAVEKKFSQGVKNLTKLSLTIENYLEDKSNIKQIKHLARKLAKSKDIYLLSRSQNLQIIKEGMVKIIEGSYLHAHAIPAGDLKHYAITLMEPGVPVIAVVSNDFVKNDVINAINEVKARGADVIAIAPENHEKYDYFLKVPDTGQTTAVMNIIPLQLLAYYLGVVLGNNIDKPRNIAKSVTVK